MKNRKSNKNKYVLLFLAIILSVGLLGGMTLARYAGEWSHSFGLSIFPVDKTNHNLRRYFRSNELVPVSENAAYTVNGTSTWFTVANALDSEMVSEEDIKYTLTWFVSEDGITWTEYNKNKVNDKFGADEYQVKKFSVSPVEVGRNVCNYIKVHGTTSSFLQEDIEAVYTFNYSSYSADTMFADGVITINIDTNDVSGEFNFSWQEGITPDNSDPTGFFKNAIAGPSNSTVTLNKNTAYQFMFFVTDAELLEQLNNTPSDAGQIVTMTKE